MSRCLSRTELSGLRVVCTVPRLQVRPLASNNEDPDRCAGARVVLKEPGACGVVGRARANRSVLSTGCKLDPTVSRASLARLHRRRGFELEVPRLRVRPLVSNHESQIFESWPTRRDG